jgi:hypothetical protein
MTEYDLHYYQQSTNHSCTPTATAMLLSHYGKTITPDDVMAAVPVNTDDQGEEIGSISQDLATWCLVQGFDVTMYSFDCQIIDLAWAKLSVEEVIERLQAVKMVRDVPNLGKLWSQKYVESYQHFLESGGELHIQPYVTESLLQELLQTGPIFVSICTQPYFDQGRTRYEGYKEEIADDVNGIVTTHSVVVYGINDDGDYLIADPWQGKYTAKSDRLLNGITAAQIECDNLLFVLREK